MIRARARDGRRRLNYIQPVHGVARPAQFAAAVKLLHIANVPGPGGQKVRIQRKNYVGLLRTIHSVDVTRKRELAALSRTVAPRRFPLVPLGARYLFQEVLDLRSERRRSDRAGQNSEARATLRLG